MNIVLFCHPTFLGSQSMPRFASMLKGGMEDRSHHVELMSPTAHLFKLSSKSSLSKWLGYIDQYIIFPFRVRVYLKNSPDNTLFVFTDNALGPWVPLVKDRPHVIHCHDFLAQRSANKEFNENATGWSGQLYQSYIRRGYRQGKNFISISNKTQHDLHHFLEDKFELSEVVYNGLNQKFISLDPQMARLSFANIIGVRLDLGYILHVGGNQWYKNRVGIIAIYNAFRLSKEQYKLPLIMVGSKPNPELSLAWENSKFKDDIHFITNLNDESVRLGYAGASVFLFPSIAEGFGWPISEAMVSGCPVITTDEDPMKEVGGEAAFYIPRRPSAEGQFEGWAREASTILHKVVGLSKEERKEIVDRGRLNAGRFNTDLALDKIESIYKKILINFSKSN